MPPYLADDTLVLSISKTSRPTGNALTRRRRAIYVWQPQAPAGADEPRVQRRLARPYLSSMAAVVFDAEVLSRVDRIPPQFVWPPEERPGGGGGVEEMDIPVVDLAVFLRGGELPAGLVEACERHGFFQVVGHGVDAELIAEAYRCCDAFYARPLAEKQRARRLPGESHGYASSFTGRFDSRLPWKETLSFHCPGAAAAAPAGSRAVADYFVGVLGEEYRHMGYV